MPVNGSARQMASIASRRGRNRRNRPVQARLRIRLLPWMSGGECLPHTVQSLGHAFPALCRAHVRLNDVLLSLRPSLPGLRGRAAQDDAGPDGEREVRR
jgi:hypothetical protein